MAITRLRIFSASTYINVVEIAINPFHYYYYYYITTTTSSSGSIYN
jgi:hypothetical protein